MVVRALQTDCGQLRLVVTGPTKRVTAVDPWWFPTAFEIPVAIENTGRTPINLPVAMSVDSSAPVQRGRQLNAFYSRDYVGFEFWRGREPQQPWRFRGPEGRETKLRSGALTRAERLSVTSLPLTQGFRVWFRIEGVLPEPRHQAGPPPPRIAWSDAGPIEPAVRQLVRSTRFPNQRAIRVIYRDPPHDLLIFDVEYGSGQDCLAGCIYSHAIGMSDGHKIGWMHLFDYEHNVTSKVAERVNQALFPIDETNTYLLSGQLLDTLGTLFGEQSWLVDQVILPLVIRDPHVHPELLVRLIEHLYTDINQSRAVLLVQSPAVKDDAALLTLLAELPNGGPRYLNVRNEAREALMRLGPDVVADSRASTRTLFVLAQTVSSTRSSLQSAVLMHPKVRSNPAILAIFEDARPELRPQLLAAVTAPARVKKMLADFLTHRWAHPDSSIGWNLLRDPDAGQNRDVLSVIANLSLSNGQGIVWAASRRLPEGSLRRWEPNYVPMQ